MIVKTQDNSIVNLASFDVLEMVYKPTYNRSLYIVSAGILDAEGKVSVEEPLREFSSRDEASDYLTSVEESTAYIAMPVKSTSLVPKGVTLLNLERFDVVRIAPPALQKTSHGRIPNSKQGKKKVVHAIQYDRAGDVKRTYLISVFDAEADAIEYIESLIVPTIQ